MPEPALEVRAVSVDYGSGLALDQVDFQLFAGEVHGLVGENGAGKSTLIKVISGALAPTSGDVVLHGVPRRFGSPRQAIAAGVSTVFQEIDLLPNLSVAENIWLGREPRRGGRLDWRAMRSATRTVLDDLGIRVDPASQLGAHPLATQQFVAIARAVTMDSSVLVLDEPTSSLDVDEVAELFRVVRDLAARGTAILFVSHFLDQVYELCDRITVLRGGRSMGEYTTAELLRIDLVEKMLGGAAPAGVRPVQSPAQESPSMPPLLVAAEATVGTGIVDADVELRAGEVLGLAGLLGSGRTELARALAGVDPLTSGEVRLGPHRLDGPRRSIRLGVAYSSENRRTEGVIGDLSVVDNIVLALQADRGVFRRLSRAQQRELAASWVDALHIRPADIDRPVATLSGGNQQKVLLARLMALSPRVMVLDEPTRGIDIGAKVEVQNIVAELAANGVAVVFVSAELEEVLRVSDRVALLRDGRIVDVLSAGALSPDRLLALVAAPSEDIG